MTEAFSQDGIAKLDIGTILGFTQEDGTIDYYKIIKKKDSRIWGKMVRLYNTDEVSFGKEDAKKITEMMSNGEQR